MAHRKEDRYAAATDLAKEVQRWLADEPVTAYQEPWTYRLRRWGRRHRTWVASAAVLLVTSVVALTIGLILLGKKQDEVVQQRNAAQTAEANTKKSAVKLAHVKTFLLKDLLEQAAPENNPIHKEITVREAVDRAARQLDANVSGPLHDQPDLQAALREAIGNTYLSLGRLSEAATHLTQARNLAEQALQVQHPDRLLIEQSYAGLLIGQGRFADAEALLRRVLDATRDERPSRSRRCLATPREVRRSRGHATADTCRSSFLARP
jgi:tetratricopeptide (TPR) repeat protein